MTEECGVIDVTMLFGEEEAADPAKMKLVFDRNGVQLVSRQEWNTMKQLKVKAGELLSQVAQLEAANKDLTDELTKEKTSNKEKAATERTRISTAIKSIAEATKYPVKTENVDLLSYQYLNGLHWHISNSTRNSSSRHSNPGTSTAPEPEPPTETSSIGDAQPGNLNTCPTAEPPTSAGGNNVPGPSQSSQVSLALLKTAPRDDEHEQVSELTSLQGTTTGLPETALLPNSNNGVPLVVPSPTEIPLELPSNTGVNAPKPTPTPREDTSSSEMEPGVNLGLPNGNEPSSTNGSRKPSSGSGDDQAQTPPPQVSPSGSEGSIFEAIRLPSQEARQMLRKRKMKDDEDRTGSGANQESPVVQPQNQSNSTGNKFKCQVVGCGQTFLLLSHLNIHRLNEHGLQKVPGQNVGCRHCGRTFRTRAERSSHNAVKCTVQKPNQDPQRHGIALGTSSNPHRCTCGRSCLSLARLNAHIRSPLEY